jgi:hypothetical protein
MTTAPFPEEVLFFFPHIFFFLFTSERPKRKKTYPAKSTATEPSALEMFASLQQVNSFFYAVASKYAVRTLYRPGGVQLKVDNDRHRDLISRHTRSLVLSDHAPEECQDSLDLELKGIQDILTLVVRPVWDPTKGIWRCIHRDGALHQPCGFVTNLRPRKLVIHDSTVVFPRVWEEQCLPREVLDSMTTHIYLLNDENVLLGLDGKCKSFMGGIGGLNSQRAAKLSNLVIIFAVNDPAASWHPKHRSNAILEGGWLWELFDELARFIASVPPSCQLTIVHSGAIDIVGGIEDLSWCCMLRQNNLEALFQNRLVHHLANRRGRVVATFNSVLDAFLMKEARNRDVKRLQDRRNAVQFLTMREYLLKNDWADVFDTNTARQYLNQPGELIEERGRHRLGIVRTSVETAKVA